MIAHQSLRDCVYLDIVSVTEVEAEMSKWYRVEDCELGNTSRTLSLSVHSFLVV